MSAILLTGFPGFLGSELAKRLLARDPRHSNTKLLCLVQPKFAALAAERASAIAKAAGAPRGAIRCLEGDLTAPDLGLAPKALRDVRQLFHFAAIYDLAVPRKTAWAVNVEGTARVVELARKLPQLERLDYVSTCYVSGRWPGIFRERDLERGQRFNNHYEETKYEAERLVRAAMAQGLPAAIYRPGIVIGDSRSGETQKFDGPYFVTQWLLKQPSIALLPVPLGADDLRVNLVPRDYVIGAIEALSAWPGAIGTTYQLADPDPPTIDETIALMGEATGRVVVRAPVPVALTKAALDWLPGVGRIVGIPSHAIDYFAQPTFYDTANATRDLARFGIVCPPLADYFPRCVDFQRRHPELSGAAMA